MKTVNFSKKVNAEQLLGEIFDGMNITASCSFDSATNTGQVIVNDGANLTVLNSIIGSHSAKPAKDKKAEYQAAMDKLDYMAKELGYK